MRRRKDQTPLILAGLAPLIAGAAYGIYRLVARRRGGPVGPYSPLPRQAARRMARTRLPLPSGEHAAGLLPETAGPSRPSFDPSAIPLPASFEGTARVYDSAIPLGGRVEPPAAAPRARFPWLLVALLAVLALFTAFALSGRRADRAQVITVPGGSVEAGRREIRSWGCGSCHTIPGIAGAYGKVGPKLDQMAEQTYIAGMLPNTPENLMEWIMNPQEIQPGNAMPDTNVTEGTARNMAAYLYSIRTEGGE